MLIRYKKALCTIIAGLVPLLSIGQNSSNSPYSMFGIGDLAKPGFGRNLAMGGVSTPLVSALSLNPENPASYVGVQPNSFIFEFGLTMNNYKLTTPADNYSTFDGNINYVAIGFPVTKWWKSGVGLLPLSSVGYDISEDVTLSDDSRSVSHHFKGEGGVNSFYFDNSFQLTKYLSVGAKVGYMFGTLDRIRSVQTIPDTLSTSTSIITDNIHSVFDAVSLKFGIHFHKLINENIFFNLGATYSLKTELKGQEERLVTNYIAKSNDERFLDTLANETLNRGTLILPPNYSIGASVILKKKLELAVDYKAEKWSESKFFGENQNYYDNQSFSAGIEFIPDYSSTKYFNVVKYRAGFNLTDSYLMINDKQLKQMGISAGLGLPIRSGASINMAFIYNTRTIPGDDILSERYLQFHLNLSLKSNWFIKRKFL